MRVMLLHKLAGEIPENYVPPEKLIADVGKMVSDARGVHRMSDPIKHSLPRADD